MKFCYTDESGTGSEPYAVMATIVVDYSRMQITKDDWIALLLLLTKLIGKQVKEFHAKDFYSGNGIWSKLDGEKRSAVISAILDWIRERKHKISFCAIDKKKFNDAFQTNEKLKDIGSLWCMLGFHQILILQKEHQKYHAKGYSILIFDDKLEERSRIEKLVKCPPVWTNTYYFKKTKEHQLSKIVDVPYFGNSENVHLLQIADLIAYILRRYAEICDARSEQRYENEKEKITVWVNMISKLALSKSSRYLKKGRCQCAELFFEYAPNSIRSL